MELAEILTMTGCRDAADLQDMANVGKSMMDRMADVIEHGPLKGWSPADDPAEIVTDLANEVDELREKLKAAEQPIADAPKDGTMIWLLVDYSEGGAPLADAQRAWTIGFNNLGNTGEDKWEFAGWCWSHDHFTEGSGTPLAWKSIGFELEVES